MVLARRMLLALLLALTVSSGARADDWDDGGDLPDDWDDAPAPEAYEEALAPYGSWVTAGSLGYVWRPRVAFAWAPYLDGRWVWTAWGWTWLSWEPWAWTFHYGRWSWAPAWGWVWVPGSVWSPAWVSWHWGGGYVGWAPYGWVGPSHWIWVRDRDFCAPRLRHVLVHHDRLPAPVRTLWHGRPRADAPPPRHDIERVSRFDLPRYHERPRQTVAPWHARRTDELWPRRLHNTPIPERREPLHVPGRSLLERPLLPSVPERPVRQHVRPQGGGWLGRRFPQAPRDRPFSSGRILERRRQEGIVGRPNETRRPSPAPLQRPAPSPRFHSRAPAERPPRLPHGYGPLHDSVPRVGRHRLVR